MLRKVVFTLILMLVMGLTSGLFAQYIVDFEGVGETKTAYASGTVNLSGLNWNMTESLIGTEAADWKNGARSTRMRGYAASSMTMLADKANGLGTLSFQYRRYGTDAQVDWKAEYSTDGGSTWAQIGAVFTAPASDVVQTFSEVVNVEGNVRVRIKRATESGSSNRRLNIDDITLTDFTDEEPPDPEIVITGTILPFNTTVGVPSATQEYHLQGLGLENDISVAVNPPFQIRKPNDSWGTTLDLPYNYNGYIEVQYNPDAAGTHNQTITHIHFDASFNPTQASINVSGTAVQSPTIVVGGAQLQNFSTFVGTPSAAQSYTVTGQFLTEDIVVVAPAQFEVSSDGTTYLPQISLSPTYNGLVYVRMTGATEGSYAGNITHNSTGAAEVVKGVTGAVNEPIIPELLLEDNFDYAQGSLLTANGYEAHSGAGSNAIYVTTPNLTFDNYPTNLGLSAYLSGDGEDVNRAFETQSTGSVYASFLVNISEAKATGEYFFHFGQSTLGTVFRAKVFVNKESDTNNIRFGITKAANYSVSIATTPYDYVYGTTYLLVVKYVFNESGNDQVYLFVNPDFSGSEPAPTLTALDPTGGDLTDLSRFALRKGTSSNAPTLLIDGIRIANDWNMLWYEPVIDGEINVVSDMEDFVSVAGSPSERQSYSLQGIDLESDIQISASAGYEISTTGNAPWVSSLSVPANYNGSVYVRLNVASEGRHSGTITHSSYGVSTVILDVDGEAFPPQATINVTENLASFFAVDVSAPSDVQTYNLSGSDLIGGINILASSPWQVRVSPSGEWGSSVNVDQYFNGSIDVRINTATAGNYTGTITHSSNEAANVVINVSANISKSVSSITELRTQTTGTMWYTLSSEAILTYQKPTYNQKFLQDSGAAILIHDTAGIITTTYNLYDGITGITGTLETFNQLLQIVPKKNAAPATSTGNVVVPEVRTLASLTSSDQSKLVKIPSVSFSDTGDFGYNVSYNITDPSGASVFRTGFSAADGCDYISTPIPTAPKDIVVLVGQYGTAIQITARYLSDFTDVVAADPTKLAITNINPASPIVDTEFSITVQAQDEEGIARNVTTDTVVTLSLLVRTGELGGTLTGSITQGTSSVTISGITYNAVEDIIVTASATSGMTLTAVNSNSITIQSVPVVPGAFVVTRPSQIDISEASSQSAVLMQVQAYETAEPRYRLYNGSNQYNCWNGTTYVTNTSYANGPVVLGDPTTTTTWWIVFQRGGNVSVAATYRDRKPPYTATADNIFTIPLPAATEITNAFGISMRLPLVDETYNLENKYVVLGYDAEVAGTLITATSTDLTTGAFTLKVQDGTTIRRIEVRSLTNELLESMTGEWSENYEEPEDDYYASVEGLSGSELRSGLKTITTTGHNSTSYDNARLHMINTLDNIGGTVTCVYTGYQWNNRETLSAEHSYPQSWFSDHPETNWMVSDLHALFPTTLTSNNARSNYPYDYITNITTIYGSGDYLSYSGRNSANDLAFEVPDDFKGDAARALLYMGMRYYDDDTNFIRGNVNLLPILLQWNELDPVDAFETNRNNGVHSFQNNRNPFVDHPEWITSIWGSIGINTPVASSASAINETKFNANWASITGATGYRLDVSNNSTFTSMIPGYKNKVVSGNSHEVNGLTLGNTYYYRVRALNANNLSLHSNTISVTTATPTVGEANYYWNFNANVPTSGNWSQPIASVYGDGSLSYTFLNAVSFGGTIINGITGEENGGSFVPQGGTDNINNGKYLELTIPSTGLENIVLSYAARKTTTGFNQQDIQYTVDGDTWQSKEVVDVSSFTNNWLANQVISIDFTGVAGVDNNPNFKVRIVLTGASDVAGNNRFDNIKVVGEPFSGGGDLDTPLNVQISHDGTNVTITWDTVNDATAYKVFYTDDPENWNEDNFYNAATNSLSRPEADAKKFYRVRAVN